VIFVKEELWNIGKRNVDREYELLLGKHSNGSTNITVITSDSNYDNQSISDENYSDAVDDSSSMNGKSEFRFEDLKKTVVHTVRLLQFNFISFNIR
jgi:hypothetical protein